MQLFVTLDRAAQGRVQGECRARRAGPPSEAPRGPASPPPAPSQPCAAPQASAGTSTAWKGTTSGRPAGWWRPRGPASPTPGRPRQAVRTSWTGWTTPAPSTSRAVRLGLAGRVAGAGRVQAGGPRTCCFCHVAAGRWPTAAARQETQQRGWACSSVAGGGPRHPPGQGRSREGRRWGPRLPRGVVLPWREGNGRPGSGAQGMSRRGRPC